MNGVQCLPTEPFGIIQNTCSFMGITGRFVSSAPTPAVWPKGRDALMNWRALFERSELVRPPQVWRPSAQMSQTGRPWFWGLLPEQKGLVCRGETRQHRTSRRHESGGHTWNAFTCQHVLGTTPKRDSRYTSSSCKARTIRPIFYMIHLFSIFVPTSPIPCHIVAYKLQLNLWRADPKNSTFLSRR